MVIERIETPADVKALSRDELDVLAREIRDMLVVTCSRNGGHLAPNLGVVELTIALHRVLDLPGDKLVWDVSHQAYVHKILSGRRDRFHTLRKGGGISGFSMRSESPFDQFGAGHASTSVSAAYGMAVARDLAGSDETVVAVLGDGALTGGLAYEALNNAGQLNSNFIVILNDNEMSIAPNVGSIASYLSVLRSKPFANFVRERAKGVFEHMPFGGAARKAFASAEMGALRFVAPSEKAAVIFEELGFRYMGPFDGHNIDTMIDALETAKSFDRPVLLHVRTLKGKGYEPAEKDSRTFHGVSVFDVENGKLEIKPDARPTFSDVFAGALIELAQTNRKIIAITAAMPDGTKLSQIRQGFSRSVLRRRYCRSACGVHGRGCGDQRIATGLRDLLDVLAARVRPGRARRMRPKSPGRVLHGSRRLRRRRRPDAHGALRHRVSAHASEHVGDGAT